MNHSFVQRQLIYLTAGTATMVAWQYNVGLRLIAHDLFAFLFVIIFLLGLLIRSGYKSCLPKEIKNFLLFYSGFFAIKLLSGLGLLQYSLRSDALLETALTQYSKGIVKEFVVLLMFFSVAVYMTKSTTVHRHKIVNVFVGGIAVSCVYQLVSLVALKQYNLEFDRLIWPNISYNLTNESFLKEQIYGVSGMVMYRSGGFSINPNSMGGILACVIPFTILYAMKIRRSYVLLTVLMMVSLLITVSRSGMLATVIALFVLALSNFKRFFTSFKFPLLFMSVLLIGLVGFYHEQIILVLESRIDTTSGSSFSLGTRGYLLQMGIDIFLQYPIFGVGYGNSGMLVNHYPKVLLLTGADFHHFWLIKLIELGLIGFIYYLGLHLFILIKVAKHKNIYGKSLFYSLLGLSVSGFFNNALSNFEFQFFILIFFCTSCLESKQTSGVDSIGLMSVSRRIGDAR